MELELPSVLAFLVWEPLAAGEADLRLAAGFLGGIVTKVRREEETLLKYENVFDGLYVQRCLVARSDIGFLNVLLSRNRDISVKSHEMVRTTWKRRRFSQMKLG